MEKYYVCWHKNLRQVKDFIGDNLESCTINDKNYPYDYSVDIVIKGGIKLNRFDYIYYDEKGNIKVYSEDEFWKNRDKFTEEYKHGCYGHYEDWLIQWVGANTEDVKRIIKCRGGYAARKYKRKMKIFMPGYSFTLHWGEYLVKSFETDKVYALSLEEYSEVTKYNPR